MMFRLTYPKQQEADAGGGSGAPTESTAPSESLLPKSDAQAAGSQTVGPDQKFELHSSVYGEPDMHGRPAKIPAKYWDPENKALRVDDLFNRSQTLESTVGSFTGAPEHGYELRLPETDDGKPVMELGDDDPMLGRFRDVAKEVNMSQEGFDALLTWWIKENADGIAQQEADAQARAAEEMERIGPNADKQLSALNQWFENAAPQNMGHGARQEFMETFRGMVTTAAQFRVMSHLAKLSRVNPLPSLEEGRAGAMTEAQVLAMQNEPDPSDPTGKRRKYDIDPAHRKKVTQAWLEVRGSGEGREEVNFNF